MKLTSLVRATLLASILGASLSSARAGLVVDNPGYVANSVYDSTGTPANGNDIVSFDWDSSNNLYYSASVSGYLYGGFYKVTGGTTTALTLTSTSTPGFSGASVVTINNHVYMNDGDGNVYIYDPSNPASLSSISPGLGNYALFGHSGQLYITGSGATTNQITYSGLNPDGSLVNNPPQQLEHDSAYSGPLDFDSSGNLYYVPGYGNQSIYKWTSAQVAAALANPALNFLTLGSAQKWLDYSTLSYSAYSGGTSLLINNGQLLLTLTNFSDPSVLVSFDINSTTGDYVAGSASTLVEDTTGALGQLRVNGGNIYLSDGTQIFEVQSVPEPSTFFLLALGLAGLVYFRRRQIRRLAPVAVVLTSLVFFSITSARAGPFSPAADQPGSTGVSASSSAILEWANGVVTFAPGPVDITQPTGAVASFGSSANALGASDSTQANPNNVVSLGDGGSITLSFASPITNGAGTDFAVFENAFPQSGVPNSYFLELATVSVSSDGIHFFTFPSVSLTPTGTQVSSFGTLDPTNLYNLAGSEIVGYGTPFNLDDLSGITSPYLNINSITQVRVTDVIGNINTTLTGSTVSYTYDDASNPIFNGAYGTTNNLINDPFKTNFSSGGFDLDAIGVINMVPEPSTVCFLAFSLILLAMARRNLRQI